MTSEQDTINKPKMTNKQKRNLFFVLTILFSLAIPILVIMIKYDMFHAYLQASTTVKISIIGCILIILIVLINLRKIRDYLENTEFSVFKCIVNGFIKIIPLACALLILVNVQKLVTDLTYITGWLLGCNMISLFIFEPLYKYYKNECKLDKEYKKWHKRELENEES